MALDRKDPQGQALLHRWMKENQPPPAPGGPDAPKGGPPRRAASGTAKKQRAPRKKTRAGAVLSRDEVRAIRKGRRKLRRELRQRGVRSRDEFEMTAGSLGLYFDGRHSFWLWLWSHWLGALLGALAALLGVLFLFAMITQLRGHFTVNLSDGMFKNGFTLSDNAEFKNATSQLFANPAQDVTCISINQIPVDINDIDGEHNNSYCAYTYYIRNEGEGEVGYRWSVDFTAETQDLSEALWVILFEDDRMRIYAKENSETGNAEALPAFGDNTRGYLNLPIMALAPDSRQFQVVRQRGALTWWRVIPDKFVSDTCAVSGVQSKVKPMEVHKYTVVVYLEGDDAQADDSKIGGHAGVEMNFHMVSEADAQDKNAQDGLGIKWKKFFESLWGGLKFW